MRGLDARVALVTGAGGGIGREIVDVLLSHGMSVAGMEHPDGAAIDDRCAASERVDLRDASAVAAALGRIAAVTGPVDVAVLNAGLARAESLSQTNPDRWRAEVEANLNGHYHCFHALAPAMRERGRGVVVAIASANAALHVGNPPYSAAKAGLLAMVRAIAVEEGRHGIRAVGVSPGTVRTPIWDERVRARPDILERMSRWYPLGRVAEPREVAEAVAFLASDHASAITGCTLPVDCGLTAGNLRMAAEIVDEAL